MSTPKPTHNERPRRRDLTIRNIFTILLIAMLSIPAWLGYKAYTYRPNAQLGTQGTILAVSKGKELGGEAANSGIFFQVENGNDSATYPGAETDVILKLLYESTFTGNKGVRIIFTHKLAQHLKGCTKEASGNLAQPKSLQRESLSEFESNALISTLLHPDATGTISGPRDDEEKVQVWESLPDIDMKYIEIPIDDNGVWKPSNEFFSAYGGYETNFDNTWLATLNCTFSPEAFWSTTRTASHFSFPNVVAAAEYQPFHYNTNKEAPATTAAMVKRDIRIKDNPRYSLDSTTTVKTPTVDGSMRYSNFAKIANASPSMQQATGFSSIYEDRRGTNELQATIYVGGITGGLAVSLLANMILGLIHRPTHNDLIG